MMSDAGRLDEKLLALLDEALERIGPERTARRAALLSAKSAEMYWVDNDLTESTRLVDEAIEIAREVDAPATLAAALHRKIFIPLDRTPRASGSRLADEMLELGEACGQPRGGPARSRLPALAVPRARRHRGGRPRAGQLRQAGGRAAHARAHLARPSLCAGCGRCSTATSTEPSAWPARRGGRASEPSSRSPSSSTASR